MHLIEARLFFQLVVGAQTCAAGACPLLAPELLALLPFLTVPS